MVNKLIKCKLFWFILIIIFVIIFSFIRCPRTVDVDFSKTDSIATRNDSLQVVIDELDSLLNVNKVNYETLRDSITNQSVDDDCEFFSKYLSSKFR